MNETHTNFLLEEWELDLATPIDIPPMKWLDPTPPAEIPSPRSRGFHFPATC